MHTFCELSTVFSLAMAALLLLNQLKTINGAFSKRQLSTRICDHWKRQNVRKNTLMSRHCLTQQLCTTSLNQSIELELDAFQQCWSANSWSVNPHGYETIDRILNALHSPAPQSFYAIQRAIDSVGGDEDLVRDILRKFSYLLKDNFNFAVKPFACCPSGSKWVPGVHWTVISTGLEQGDWLCVERTKFLRSASTMASGILSIIEECSETQSAIDENEVRHRLDQMEEHLSLTLGTDIRGRTSADTAFTLALAGVKRDTLYKCLGHLSSLELQRLRHRTSRRAKHVLHTVEKLAASGIRGAEAQNVYTLALKSEAMTSTQYESTGVLQRSEKFDLLSDRPLLWLWRYAARRVKAKEIKDRFLSSPANYTLEKLQNFDNPKKPLVIDIGCGMGVSLLGLASEAQTSSSKGILNPDFRWNEFNFLGVDLSQLGTRFGQSISHRWSLQKQLQYVYAPAELLLERVLEVYPGRVALILIQFPTPYRLNPKVDGNSQLPTDRTSGFMVSERLMSSVAKILKKSNGRLLLQSNCEDVAITMRDLAKSIGGMECVQVLEPVTSCENGAYLPRRTAEWIRQGGERAIGPEWSAIPLLPTRCSTETEIACLVQKTPVHRCVMQGKNC